MQRSELFNPGFVVPLNDMAEKSLFENDIEEDVEVRVVEIPEGVLTIFYYWGFFKMINGELGLGINESMEQVISPQLLTKLDGVIDRYRNKMTPDPDEKIVLDDLKQLTKLANEQQRPIFVIL